MIVTEHRLRDLFELLPVIKRNSEDEGIKPFFGWGDKYELDRNLQEYQSSLYPLIWLLDGQETYNRKVNKMYRKCVFILATLEKKRDRLNPTRYAYNYDVVLNPLLDNIDYALRRSSITRVIDEEVSIYKKPNYTEKDGVIDLWDAIRYEVNLEIDDNCLKNINFKK